MHILDLPNNTCLKGSESRASVAEILSLMLSGKHFVAGFLFSHSRACDIAIIANFG